MNSDNKRKFCVAPMMGYTTPHARKLYRMLSKNAFLFTEMVPAKTLIHSKNIDSIIENNNQNPVSLQVGGSDITDLIKSSKIASQYKFDEINLNVGCPSKAVIKGKFGACLMNEKKLVRLCLEEMLNHSSIEVSLKCRIGIGKELNYEFLKDFIDEIAKSGIKIIYVHARNAILNGLSPKNNRLLPPLKYEFVENIKKDFPDINFIINGGINTLEEAYKFSKIYDGVMVGRMIQSNPFCLEKVDKLFYNKSKKILSYENIIVDYFDYIKDKIKYESIYRLLSPLLQIFFSVPNSKRFKNEINSKIKTNQIEELQNLFLKFANKEIYFN